ncbi:MAG: DUF401 family protein [Archaeoglobi archaeon]|nr:DUF401 family protein [Candidatus Mnemosynella bozhongmuii]
MVDVAIALLASFALIFALIARKINPAICIFAGLLLLGILSIQPEMLPKYLLMSFTSRETVEILVIVTFALAMSFSMEINGMLSKITDSLTAIAGKWILILAPMLIGLLPMPGGAIVSAMMVADTVRRYRISPEFATFTNYWFRHVLVLVWPVYPVFLIIAEVVDSPYALISEYMLPASISVLLFGVLVSFREMRKIEMRRDELNRRKIFELLVNSYPIFSIIIFSLIFKIPLYVVVPITALSVLLFKKMRKEDILKAYRKSLDFSFIALILGVMAYKDLIEITGAAEALIALLESMKIPVWIIAPLLSFLMGLSSGVDVSYASTVFPLFTEFLKPGGVLSQNNLILMFVSGFIGVMMSPMHLCLIITLKFFKAELRDTYRYILPSSILSILSAILIARIL